MGNDSEFITITIPAKFVAPFRKARTIIKKILGQNITSMLMILLGLLILVFFIIQGIVEYEKNNSPLDEIDQAPGNQSGILSILEVEGGLESAIQAAPSWETSFR